MYTTVWRLNFLKRTQLVEVGAGNSAYVQRRSSGGSVNWFAVGVWAVSRVGRMGGGCEWY